MLPQPIEFATAMGIDSLDQGILSQLYNLVCGVLSLWFLQFCYFYRGKSQRFTQWFYLTVFNLSAQIEFKDAHLTCDYVHNHSNGTSTMVLLCYTLEAAQDDEGLRVVISSGYDSNNCTVFDGQKLQSDDDGVGAIVFHVWTFFSFVSLNSPVYVAVPSNDLPTGTSTHRKSQLENPIHTNEAHFDETDRSQVICIAEAGRSRGIMHRMWEVLSEPLLITTSVQLWSYYEACVVLLLL